MTSPDFDRPTMVWTGPLPAHLRRPGEPRTEPRVVNDLSDEPPPRGSLRTLTVGVSVAIGIGIGGVVAYMARPAMPIARQAAPAPVAVQTLSTTTAPSGEMERVALRPPIQIAAAMPSAAPRPAAAPRPKKATAQPIERPRAVATTEHPRNCSVGSRAEQAICADPGFASADRDLQQAFQRALKAGAPADALHSSQIEWLILREEAARRSPDALTGAYKDRIAELNTLAKEPPH